MQPSYCSKAIRVSPKKAASYASFIGFDTYINAVELNSRLFQKTLCLRSTIERTNAPGFAKKKKKNDKLKINNH
jgi:hypothetical protein